MTVLDDADREPTEEELAEIVRELADLDPDEVLLDDDEYEFTVFPTYERD